MAAWPLDGTNPWSTPLRAYIDDADGQNAYVLQVLGATRAFAMGRVDVQTAAYAAAPGEYVPVDTTAGAVAVTLPDSPPNGVVVGVHYLAGVAGNLVAIGATNSHFDSVTGGALFYLLYPGQVAVFQYADAYNLWHLVGGNVASLAPIDLRYTRALKDDAGASYNDSAAATSLFAGTLFNIGPNSLAVGDLIEVVAWGGYTNNSGANRNLTIATLFDAVTVAQTSNFSIATNATQRSWRFDARIRVVALGVSGSVKSISTSTLSAPGSVGNDVSGSVNTVATVDTTQALTIDLKSTLSAATTGILQVVDCEGINVKKVPAP